MKRTIRRTFGKRGQLASLLVVLALVSSIASAKPDDDHGRPQTPAPTGTIKYPCTDPTLVKVFRDCGYTLRGGQIHPGDPYVLHPRRPADLDIYFYDAGGELLDPSAGPLGSCGNIGHQTPLEAVTAVVVSSASHCFMRPGGSFDGSVVNVAFDFS